jgi:hypothetical protein
MQSASTIRCSNCGQPINTRVVSFLDAQQEPGLKAQLINQQLNRVQCPSCGAVNTIAAPLLYHDASKELLVVFVPMELNISKDQMERIIGDLMKLLPRENFKGYMFNPKRTLTMQGLIEMVLQADGITPEMINEAKARTQLVQQFVEASDDDLMNLIAEHDAGIDAKFMQTFTSLAQRLAQSGRADMAQAVLATQQVVIEHSTYGKQLQAEREAQQAMVEVVARDIEALGEEAGREELLDLAVRYADDDIKVQALVSLVRPVMDEEFMGLLDARIAGADDAGRAVLDGLKARLIELMAMIDQQTQIRMGAVVQFLQALMTASNLDEMLQANAGMIDETFMAVLTANIQEAERRRDLASASRLRQIYERVVGMIQQTMPAEVQFLNQLLSASDEATVEALLREGLTHFGPALVELLGVTADSLGQQGRADLSARLSQLQARATEMMGQG